MLKKRVQRKAPPYLSPPQVMYLLPSPGSGQGAHASSRLANLKQIVTGRSGGGGALQEGLSADAGNSSKME